MRTSSLDGRPIHTVDETKTVRAVNAQMMAFNAEPTPSELFSILERLGEEHPKRRQLRPVR